MFDGQQCLRFAAHMTGSDIGTLEVLRMTSQGEEQVLYSVSGQQSAGQWFSRSLTATVNSGDRGVGVLYSLGGNV